MELELAMAALLRSCPSCTALCRTKHEAVQPQRPVECANTGPAERKKVFEKSRAAQAGRLFDSQAWQDHGEAVGASDGTKLRLNKLR